MLLADLSDFPVEPANGKGRYVIERPTRLGNIIAGYELYPQTRYGVDSLAFWYHLLILAPESARKAYEEKVAFAEGMVLTSATGALVAAVALCSLLGRVIGKMSGHALINLPLPASIDAIGCLGGIAAWFVFYKLSLPAHRQVRSVFQALTDLTMSRLTRYIKSFDITQARSGISEKSEAVKDYLELLYAKNMLREPPPTTQSGEVTDASHPHLEGSPRV